MTGERFKEWFLEARRGGNFLKAVAVFLIGWFALRAWLQFDPDNSWLNLILSVEASIAGSLILDTQLKQAESDRAVMDDIQDGVEEIQEDVEEIQDDLKKASD